MLGFLPVCRAALVVRGGDWDEELWACESSALSREDRPWGYRISAPPDDSTWKAVLVPSFVASQTLSAAGGGSKNDINRVWCSDSESDALTMRALARIEGGLMLRKQVADTLVCWEQSLTACDSMQPISMSLRSAGRCVATPQGAAGASEPRSSPQTGRLDSPM